MAAKTPDYKPVEVKNLTKLREAIEDGAVVQIITHHLAVFNDTIRVPVTMDDTGFTYEFKLDQLFGGNKPGLYTLTQLYPKSKDVKFNYRDGTITQVGAIHGKPFTFRVVRLA